jgi:uncharacterized protein YcbK (DUF882 family)
MTDIYQDTSPWNPATTPSFKLDEFRCNCGKCDGLVKMTAGFMRMAQELRHILGTPLTVVPGGGYRCPVHPDLVARPGSFHGKGRAADLRIDNGSHRMKLVNAGLAMSFGGFGFGRTFLHLDNRPASERTSWTY